MKTQTQTVLVTNFREFTKGTLRGFFDVELPSGLILRECSLHSKDGARWINPPSRKFTGKDGKSAYKRMADFPTRELADRFRDEVLAVLDAGREHEGSAPEISDEDLPF